MLAAIVKILGIMDKEEFIKDMEKSFKHKFATKPNVIPKNIEALKRGLQEVKGLE